MNANQLLKQDHDQFKQLYQQFQSASGQQQQQILQQALQMTFAHSEIEKQIYYPALEQVNDQRLQQLVADAYQDHQKVDQMTRQLMSMQGQPSTQTETLFRQMAQDFIQHAEEEEHEMFPLAQQHLGQQLDQLGQQMQQQKQQLMASAPTP